MSKIRVILEILAVGTIFDLYRENKRLKREYTQLQQDMAEIIEKNIYESWDIDE